jgi:UDP-N-acetylmuramoylalanine--D-glutamate ligase
VAIDDAPSADARAAAGALGVELMTTPSDATLDELLASCPLVVVSPGVPPFHPVIMSAPAGVVVSEVELAARLGGPPIVAITGTNGKTTVTSLVAAMLEASGRRTRAAGNIGYPLIEAVGEVSLDCIVAEVSSFQLALTTTFAPIVATWLNFAEDHLDWHRDLREYAQAKARIWAHQRRDDVSVANRDDAVVADYATRSPGRLVTFGHDSGDFHLDGDDLVAPDGSAVLSTTELVRALPHDVMNALAAVATAAAAGADLAACAGVLRTARPLRHRVELVETIDGVSYFDDSKATTPSSVIAAIAGFDSVVLIAGGRNKGLDLGAIARALEDGSVPTTVRAVVAIGESADEIVKAFSAQLTVVAAASMDEAVLAAARFARPGDAVLLSPGCASFDWYINYEERGDDFARAVTSRRRGADVR